MPLVVILAILTIEYEHSSFITGIYRDNNVNYKYKKYIAATQARLGKASSIFREYGNQKSLEQQQKERHSTAM